MVIDTSNKYMLGYLGHKIFQNNWAQKHIDF